MTIISQEAMDLLRALSANNEREWYKARKDKFETLLLEPFAQLLEQISQRLDAEGYSFCGGRETMFRMHRDTRFSKDKSPYKASVSGMLTPSGTKSEERGCVYVHLGANESFAAFGRYNLDAKSLGPIRDKIIGNDEQFRNVLDSLQDGGLDLVRQNSLATMPRGYAEHAQHQFAEELKLKSMMVRVEIPFAAWPSGDVGEIVTQNAVACADFIDFIAS